MVIFHSYVKLPEGTIKMNDFFANGMFLYHPPKKTSSDFNYILGLETVTLKSNVLHKSDPSNLQPGKNPTGTLLLLSANWAL
jgi:hypothetical protein